MCPLFRYVLFLKTRILISLCIFSSLTASASIEKPTKSNSATLESSVNYFSVRTAPLQGGESSFKFAPNSNGRYGVTLSLWGVSTFLGSTSGESDAQLARYGHTEYKDYRLFFPLGTSDSWFASGYYTSYLGLHIEDINSPQNNTTGSSGSTSIKEIKRSTMNLTNSGAEIYYVLTPNDFSLSAALFQTKIQSSSGFGLIFSISQDQFNMIDVESLIPSLYQAEYGTDSNITRTEFKSILLNVGVGATSVLDKYDFISCLIMGGSGYQSRIYGNEESSLSASGSVQRLYGLLTLGHSNQRAFYGVNGYLDQMISQTTTIQFVRNLSALKLFFGIRF